MRKIEIERIGADIEVFLQDKKTGEVVSAEGIVKGTKEEPFMFDPNDEYSSTSLDNVLAEFTIVPAETAEEWIQGINKSMSFIKDHVLPENLEILATPSAKLDEKYLKSKQAIKFGCDPDFNAYLSTVNPAPKAKDKTLRSAGGHTHIGYKDPWISMEDPDYDLDGDKERCNIIKVVDLFVGIPSVLQEPDNERKRLYGSAGAYRPKPYGVEYRTISNYYLNSEKLMLWVYNSIRDSIDFLNENGPLDDDTAFLIEETINQNDKHTAEEIIKEYGLQLA